MAIETFIYICCCAFTSLLYTLFSPFHPLFSSLFCSFHFARLRGRSNITIAPQSSRMDTSLMPDCATVPTPVFCAFGFDGGGCGERNCVHRHGYGARSRAPSHNTFVKDNPNWAYLLSEMQTSFYRDWLYKLPSAFIILRKCVQ